MQNDEFRNFMLHREELRTNPDSEWEYAKVHLPNLHRSDDRTTKLMFKAYDNGKGNPDLLLYPVLFRMVNYWPSLREIDTSLPFTFDFAYVYCKYLEAGPKKDYAPFSNTSYIAPASKGGEFLYTVLDKMLRMKERVLQTLAVAKPSDLVYFLSRYRMVGDITAIEITKDILYILHGDMGEQWNTPWKSTLTTAALNYIADRKITTYLPDLVYYAEIDALAHLFRIKDNYYIARALASFCRAHLKSAAPPYVPQSALADSPSFAEFALEFNL